jgi:hypothetical protein
MYATQPRRDNQKGMANNVQGKIEKKLQVGIDEEKQ